MSAKGEASRRSDEGRRAGARGSERVTALFLLLAKRTSKGASRKAEVFALSTKGKEEQEGAQEGESTARGEKATGCGLLATKREPADKAEEDEAEAEDEDENTRDERTGEAGAAKAEGETTDEARTPRSKDGPRSRVGSEGGEEEKAEEEAEEEQTTGGEKETAGEEELEEEETE